MCYLVTVIKELAHTVQSWKLKIVCFESFSNVFCKHSHLHLYSDIFLNLTAENN